MAEDELERRDIEALLAARRDLGRDYESDLIDSFTERVERAITVRREADVRRADRADRAHGAGQIRQFVIGLVSLGVGVPITIVPITATSEGLPAVALGWLGIIGVNFAHSRAIKKEQDRR